MKFPNQLRRVLALAEVSPEEYLQACDAYLADWQNVDGRLAEIPHDIGFAMDNAGLTPLEGAELFLRLYHDMPCYALLTYQRWWISEPTLEQDAQIMRSAMWASYRAHFSRDDDRYAEPVAYSLWCDWFEDPDTVEEAWSAMTAGEPNDTLLKRLLDTSGPVPYSLKAPLYEVLLPKPDMHEAIFRSLLYSRFDVFGQIDEIAAAALLQKLSLSPPAHART